MSSPKLCLLAHDFNNLLTIIYANCTYMCDSLPPASTEATHVKSIWEANHQLADLLAKHECFLHEYLRTPKGREIGDSGNDPRQLRLYG
jgi:hypothetical protein